MKIDIKTQKSMRYLETKEIEQIKKNKSWSFKNTNSRHSIRLSMKNKNQQKHNNGDKNEP